MNDEHQNELEDFNHYFSNKNYEKSRRFGQSFTYDPQPLKLFLEKLGNPQHEYKTIHVAGTTGKGSAATLISRALGNSYQTGLYISPHLDIFNERISIQYNNQAENITNGEFLQIWNSIKTINLVKDLSFFDALTAISMVYFKLKKVKWAVFETGLGGKFDSTNNLNPEFCIITPIGLDHQNILGDTIEVITEEKGGIIKNGATIYAFVENQTARACLEKITHEKNATLKFYESQNNINFIENNHSFIKWIYEDYFKKTMPVIKKNIKGRLEVLSDKPLIVFDSAHNVISFRELLFWAAQHSMKWKIYINMMRERNIFEIIEFIESLRKKNIQIDIFLFPMDDSSYYESSDFKNITSIKIVNHETLIEKLSDEKCQHLITGSMRLYPEVKKLLYELHSDIS